MIIINIGDELLIGQVINTNASYLAGKLTPAGLEVDKVMVIKDDEEEIYKAMEDGFRNTDLLVMTGGLGPTKDDRTKKVICRYFNSERVTDKNTLDLIHRMMKERGMELTENNRMQAEVPAGASVLQNVNGTAPGLWMEKEGKVLVALPGVPYEMKGIVESGLVDRLAGHFKPESVILHKVVQTTGIAESALSTLLEPWETALPSHIKLAYLPRPGIIRLRLTGISGNATTLEAEMQVQVTKLAEIAGEYIWSYEDNQLEEVVGALLKKLNRQITLAESCTGGYIAHLITSVPGSSGYFKGSVVSYSNEIKRGILNVREQNLKKFGAVSEQVVSDMAINSMDLFDADYSVAVSGMAGPDGGTPEKPVGTVWIAVATNTRMTTKLFHFGSTGDRARIIERAAVAALNMLRLELLKDMGKAD